MVLPRWRLRAAVPPERLIRAAAPLLIVRVLEGLTAWVFFNEFFTIKPVRGFLLVQAAFVVYLLLNLLVALRYRLGHVSGALLGFDIVANVLTLSLPIAASGGLSSPLLLLLPLQAILYVLVFGEAAGLVALLSAGAMVAAIEIADRAVLISVVPLSDLVFGSFDHVVVFAVVEVLIGAPLATAWIRWAIRGKAQRLRCEAHLSGLGILAGAASAGAAVVGHLVVDYPLRNPVLMILVWALVGLILAAVAIPVLLSPTTATTAHVERAPHD